jgi:hypothetical protein
MVPPAEFEAAHYHEGGPSSAGRLPLTRVSMKPGAVQLAHAERAFRTLRSRDTRERPIRQHVEDRVRAHIFLCMLA